MEGRAAALGAGTVLNALATGTGAAFGIDVETRATVELDADADDVDGSIAEDADADTDLIERCVALAAARWGDGEGGVVRTDSDVPLAAGLKSSSAAANATVLATCDALGLAVGDDADDPAVDVTRLDACRLGVQAAREAGVTVTGAFDDASASMLGGVVVTDNGSDALRSRDPVAWDVLVWTPPERAYSADADVARCEAVAPMADLVADLAL
ncbi:shikimate kinase, partial [Halorubrum sp. CBA1125]|uniref:shikimate kinase n=1 Tax=Halorubrum sp. CBA1125 TaxID=2668072 RepID=UPI0012E8523E